jgi:serine/threonine-protein kinase RsbW
MAETDGAAAAVQAFLDAHVPDEDLAFRVALVASEAVTNAIEHGNQLDAARRVALVVEASPEKVVVSVEDEGVGFDPSFVPDPTHEGALMAEGGRGLFLMQELADTVRFEEQGRRVVLELRPR